MSHHGNEQDTTAPDGSRAPLVDMRVQKDSIASYDEGSRICIDVSNPSSLGISRRFLGNHDIVCGACQTICNGVRQDRERGQYYFELNDVDPNMFETWFHLVHTKEFATKAEGLLLQNTSDEAMRAMLLKEFSDLCELYVLNEKLKGSC